MFRFTIRDVLWLTVVVAIVLCWWLDRRAILARAGAAMRSLAEIIESQGEMIQSLRK